MSSNPETDFLATFGTDRMPKPAHAVSTLHTTFFDTHNNNIAMPGGQGREAALLFSRSFQTLAATLGIATPEYPYRSPSLDTQQRELTLAYETPLNFTKHS